MSSEILINVTPRETRVALVENGVLQEILIERARRGGVVGNIYKGRVIRVLPGMEAAFVDIGLERAAFLHASDIETAPAGEAPAPDLQINRLVHEGQDLLVQVIKEPLGNKGARLTTNITIPSRYLVLVPSMQGAGVSQKIDDPLERERLRAIVRAAAEAAGGNSGFIVRTAAEGCSAEAIAADLEFLTRLWDAVLRRAAQEPAGTLIHEDLPLELRMLRDLVDASVERVRIDSQLTYRTVVNFAQQFMPELAGCIEHYSGERPLFDLYSIEDELQKALQRKVQLKSGGYLIIDQTEAMTTIDVNTGAYVGHRNLEETIYKTNLEAAQAIARQLRLRNLGGIIIIDFIDMEEEAHRHQVLRVLEQSLEKDRAKSYLCQVSTLGLVEMTRKRTRESLEHILCEPCPSCGGRGTVKTAETVCYEIFREVLRAARQFDAQEFVILASQEVVDLLLDEESTSLAELEAFIGKPVRFQVESSYTQEQFDVVLM